MNQQVNTFLFIEGQTGALAGEWYAVPRSERTHISVALSLQSGTCTWEVQDRNEPADDAQTLDTGSADEAISVVRMNQMRVILTAASAATFRATCDTPMREIEEL